MTRLITSWIDKIDDTVAEWDRTLKERTGEDLVAISAGAAGLDERGFREACRKTTAAVVPITSGLGVIGSFADSVAAIINHLGTETFVTGAADVSGYYEASLRKADVVFMADDERYIAVNVKNGSIGENDEATARGYIEILGAMKKKAGGGGLDGADVLVMGYGRVGREMSRYLQEKGAAVTVYDNNRDQLRKAAAEGLNCLDDAGGIRNYRYILDVTSSGGWISREMLAADVLLAAPGVPFSLDDEAAEYFEESTVHDNLEIGTAAMLALALKGEVK